MAFATERYSAGRARDERLMATAAPQQAAGLPPQNEEAEVAVLGTVLMAEQALDKIMVELHLDADDFYRPRHQLIFKSMIRLKQKAEPEAIDAITICDDLRRQSQLEEAGGQSYIHALPTLVPSVHAVEDYAKIVRDHSILRRLLAAAHEIQQKVMTHAGDPRELVEQAEQSVFRAGHNEESSQLRSIEDVLHEELDKLERLSKEGQSLTGTPSGYRDLDEITGGFQPGNLIVLAARPAMGKSALATNIAENAAVDHGKAVALFSLEMSEGELAQRFIASRAKLNGESLRKGRVKPEQWPKVLKATEKLTQAPLFVDDSSDLGVLELRAKARRLHQRHPLGLLIIDYLQLMRPEDPRDGRVEQVGKISRGLKILARELNVPVIAISQLSRAVEARPDKRPMMADLRESGNIEQDADLVMFVYRDEYYNPETTEKPGVAEVIIGKHRNGPVGQVELTFLNRYPKFASMAAEAAPGAAEAYTPSRRTGGG
ncbi:MAG: replicative DNA helicase [Thermoleophilaceae bacterium]